MRLKLASWSGASGQSHGEAPRTPWENNGNFTYKAVAVRSVWRGSSGHSFKGYRVLEPQLPGQGWTRQSLMGWVWEARKKAPPQGWGCLIKENTDHWACDRKPGSLKGCWPGAHMTVFVSCLELASFLSPPFLLPCLSLLSCSFSSFVK